MVKSFSHSMSCIQSIVEVLAQMINCSFHSISCSLWIRNLPRIPWLLLRILCRSHLRCRLRQGKAQRPTLSGENEENKHNLSFTREYKIKSSTIVGRNQSEASTEITPSRWQEFIGLNRFYRGIVSRTCLLN